jgi:serine/threonine protein kinase/tetratricopeptide (TPR) repeat protein
MGALTQLGPYKIEALIGAGGMGQVFRATDTRLHRTVAIKILPHDKVAAPERKRRFLQEARAASALNHPNIITLYDIANDSGVDYLVMEYVPGKSLDKLITPRGLPLAEVIGYTTQIASALAAAHAAGIVHRDIKPANVIVTAEGQAKVLDFGLAKLEERTPSPEDETRTMEPALTETGIVMGTAAYMSPEQARAEEVDARTDLFSLGAVLYEMATGRRPFLRALDWATPPTDPLPPELRRIVLKLLEVDRELRYQHASEVGADLQHLKRDTDSAPVATAKRSKVVVLAAAAVLALLVAGYFYFHRPLKLTDKDTIVLADFTNATGDPVFDDTLRQGLAVQLEQSPFLSLISEERVQQTLHLMGRPADARLTPRLAREICERTGSAAVLEGSIASLGSQYVLGLRAKSGRTEGVLDEEQVQAGRKEDVLNALTQIASKFRTRVGESLATVAKHSIPLAEATTPSLEALKVYSAAWKILFSTGSAAALPLFQRAIEIDPKFAMGYAMVGRMYGDIGESALCAENTTKAYQLRDRASDREKFFITASYDLQVTGNLEKAQQTCELWAQTYPREIVPHGLLSGGIYPAFGKYKQAIEEAKKGIDLDPGFVFGYSNLAANYLFLDRLGEAENTLQRAAERKLEIPDLLIARYDIAFLRADRAGMERAAALGQGKSGAEDWISDQEALVMAYSGHLQQARRMSRRAVDLAQQMAQWERAAQHEAGAAVREAFLGNAPEARRSAMAALDLSKARDVEYGAAFALSLSGESSRSQALVNDLERRFPEDTLVRFSYLPALHAVLALTHSKPSDAVELLQVTAPYELGWPGSRSVGFIGALYPVYVRGAAYLAAHQGLEAAAEFRKILDHRGIVLSDPIGALAHLQLGRALVLLGDKTKARVAYQDFLVLWKDADPDIPILQQAKAEYSKLQQ